MCTTVIFLFSAIISISAGQSSFNLGMQIAVPATSLQFINAKKSSEPSYGVSWTDDSRILCAMYGQIEVRGGADLELEGKTGFPEGYNVHSAALVGSRLHTKCESRKEKKYIFYSGSLGEPTQTLLHSEEDEEPTKIIHISANKEYVASLDFVNKTLKVFSSINNEYLIDIQLTGMQQPYGVHLTSDGYRL